MIKYLGSVGAFVKLNDQNTGSYDFLTVYSSSAVDTALFSSTVENSSGSVVFSRSGVKSYINGLESSTLPNLEWVHLAFSFDDKLITSDSNNFVIRFGSSASGNFNIQNVYIMDSSLSASAMGYLHQEFTGAGATTVRVTDSASFSINFIDALEANYTSASINSLYQPLKDQLRFDRNVSLVSENSLSQFVSASVMVDDDLYIDGYKADEGDFILSLADNTIYELSPGSQLTTVSSTSGDFIRVVFGNIYSNYYYLYTSGSFTVTPVRPKINYYLDVLDTNNA